MALTLRHWLLGALAAMAVTSVALLPPTPAETPRGYVPHAPNPAQTANRSLVRAQEELATLLQRDSLLRDAAGAGSTSLPGLRIRFRGSWNAIRRAAIQSMIVAQWSQYQPFAAGMVITVVVAHRRGVGNADLSLLPGVAGVNRCITVIRPEDEGGHWFGHQDLGPCAFYARFGQPGSEIERWLILGQFSLGLETDWSRESRRTREFMEQDLPATWRLGDILSRGRWGLGPGSTACVYGETATCRAIILDSVGLWNPPVHNRAYGLVRRVYFWNTGVWAAFLADLIRERGTDRFGTFWRSPGSPPRAFMETYGEDIGTWGAARLAGMYPGVLPGPRVRLSSVVLTLIFAGVSAGFGAFLARRRRVV